MIPAAATAMLLIGVAYRPSAHPPISPSADTVITVRTSSSTLEFDPPSLSVRQGTRVRLRLVNQGTLPHNLVILWKEDDIDALAEAASHAGGDYLPLALKERMIAYTSLAGPEQTVETVFTVPPPGAYPYVCLVSGHSGSMLGVLRSLK